MSFSFLDRTLVSFSFLTIMTYWATCWKVNWKVLVYFVTKRILRIISFISFPDVLTKFKSTGFLFLSNYKPLKYTITKKTYFLSTYFDKFLVNIYCLWDFPDRADFKFILVNVVVLKSWTYFMLNLFYLYTWGEIAYYLGMIIFSLY